MENILKFLISLPNWYLFLCIYLFFTLFSFNTLYDMTLKEVEKINEKAKTEDEKTYVDGLYIAVSAFFHPLAVVLKFLELFVLKLVEIIYNILSIFVEIFWTIYDLIFYKGDNEDMEETKVMTRENVLLYEKHDVVTTEAVSGEDGKSLLIHGAKIFRVIKPVEEGFDVIAQYLAETDSIDLSVLHDYVGYYMVSVDRDAYNNDKFVWNCVELGEGSEDSQTFIIKNPRACTEEEIKLLNEVFPEYYDHAF